jgi:hypothetical protein
MPDQLDNHPQRHLPDLAEAQLNAFMRHLYTAITSMSDLELSLMPEQKQLSAQLKENLFALNDSARSLSPLLMQSGQLIRTLLHQRQAAKVAFMAGWNGFYYDLIAQLPAEDRNMVLPLLDSIMNDQHDDIPF